jgi:glycosyltransferase involved in cell wall biosynthesis
MENMPHHPHNIIAYVFGDAAYGITHRQSLILFMIEKGFHVHIICPPGPYVKHLKNLGAQVHMAYKLNRGGMNPLQDLFASMEVKSIIQKIKPHIIHSIAMKPMLVSLLATALMGSKKPKLFITLGGLGFLFLSKSMLVKTIRFFFMYFIKALFKITNASLILQNTDDQNTLYEAGLTVAPHIIMGSGVSCEKYPYSDPNSDPKNHDPPVISYVGRLLKDKGLYELIESLRYLRSEGIKFQCRIYGSVDLCNPASISEDEIEEWVREGIISYCGHTDNPYEAHKNSDISVLPSYREGLPKSVLEASLVGRPTIATDVPGCRHVIVNNVTGILTPLYDVRALSDAIKDLLLHKDKRVIMGKNAHEHVMKHFEDNVILSQHWDLYAELSR